MSKAGDGGPPREPVGEGQPVLREDEGKPPRVDLALSEGVLRALFAGLPVGIAISRGGALQSVNRTFLDIFRVPHGMDVTGDPALNFIAEEERSRVRDIMARREAGGNAPARYETLGRRHDGTHVPLRVYASQVSSEEGEVNLALLSDVTEQREMEAALRTSESRYRSLVEKAPLGIMSSTPDGQLLDANPALLEMLGYDSIDELKTRPLAESLYQDASARDELVERARETDLLQGVRVTWKRRDGSLLDVRLSSNILRDGGGEVIGFRTMVEDITREQALEDQMLEAQRLSALSRITGGVAHKLNNRLTVILANAEMVRGELSDGQAEALEAVDDLAQAARGAGSLIHKLMAFSRREVLHVRDVDLCQVVSDWSQILDTLLPDRIDVRLELNPATPAIAADPSALHEILINLIDNARLAIDQEGRISIRVEPAELDEEEVVRLGGAPEARYALLALEDSGSGMTPDIQERAFEPFFSSGSFGERTGLGLSVVHGLVTQQRGLIDLVTAPDEGTVVRVLLPVAKGSQLGPAASGSGSPRPSGRRRILVVEDEEAVRRVAARALRRFGFEVVGAEDGAAALELLEAGDPKPDLVLSDVVMPRMGGVELFHAMRARGFDTPVLLTSGYSGSELPDEIEKLEARFVSKPWTPTQLRDEVEAALRQAGLDFVSE